MDIEAVDTAAGSAAHMVLQRDGAGDIVDVVVDTEASLHFADSQEEDRKAKVDKHAVVAEHREKGVRAPSTTM